jgi:CubicO group peptidase (beta-lactamase class C family)
MGTIAAGAISGPLGAAVTLEDGIQATVDAFVKSSGFNGVIHFVRNGKPLFSQAFGTADVEAGRRAALDTLYPIASISKWFTSVTVLRLADQGKLRLDASLSDYLKTYRADTGAKVQLRHLLSNASGIPNGFSAVLKTDPDLWTKPFTTEQAVKAFCSGDLAFEPGSRFSYDFTNWILVKGIVEAVTGEEFTQTVDRLTLAPLGLKTILPAYSPEARSRVAAGYASLDPPVRKMFPQSVYTVASGGYCGTAADLVRAAQGVYGSPLLSASARAALRRVLVPEESYALGGRIRSVKMEGGAHAFAWETGRVDGYRSLLAHRLDGDSTLVLLNNTSIGQKDIDLFADALLAAG